MKRGTAVSFHSRRCEKKGLSSLRVRAVDLLLRQDPVGVQCGAGCVVWCVVFIRRGKERRTLSGMDASISLFWLIVGGYITGKSRGERRKKKCV